MSTWINIGLISVGAVIMGLALTRAVHFAPRLGELRHQRAWRLLVALMGFFLLGYLVAVALVLSGYLALLASITALIFALGACFVLFTVQLTISMTSELIAASHGLEQQVALRTEELCMAKEAAEAASEAKSQFLANMSHEIRTPLNGILGAAELMRELDLPAEVADYLQIISSSGENLIRVVNDVLDFSKIEAGKMSLSSVDFELPDALHRVHALLALKAEEKGLELRLEEDENLPASVHGDPMRLHQVLINLLHNAIKFTASGTVVLSAELVEESSTFHRIRFRISDTGIGIPAEVQKELFRPFTQADSSTTRRFGGTGLGLAISQRIVELMGGQIEIESASGEGATFFFTTEFGRAGVATGPLSLEAFGLDTLSSERRDGDRRILLVEDDPINQLIAQRHLEALGFVVEAVSSGEEALGRVATEAFDAVLMDCQMAGLDGYETTRRIRESERQGANGRLLIIALTAHAMKEERQRCIESGMDDFISKPFRQEELVAILDRWIG